MATAIEETDVELTDEELAAELDAEIDALIDPHGYMQRAQMAIEPSDPPDPSQDWYAEACFLHSAAENALAAFYALCDGQPIDALAYLHENRFRYNTWHKIFDKMEAQEPGSAATFITRRGRWKGETLTMRRLS